MFFLANGSKSGEMSQKMVNLNWHISINMAKHHQQFTILMSAKDFLKMHRYSDALLSFRAGDETIQIADRTKWIIDTLKLTSASTFPRIKLYYFECNHVCFFGVWGGRGELGCICGVWRELCYFMGMGWNWAIVVCLGYGEVGIGRVLR